MILVSNLIPSFQHFLLNATQSLFLCDSSSHHGKLHTGQNHTNSTSIPSGPTTSSSNHNGSPSSSQQLLRGATATSTNHGTIPTISSSTGNGTVVTGKGHNTISAFGSSLRGTSSSSRSSPSKSSSTSKSNKNKGSSSSVPSSPLLSHNHNMHHRALTSEGKSSVRSFVFVQGWQLLSLAVSLFLPKNNKLLWYLKQHLSRNIDTK